MSGLCEHRPDRIGLAGALDSPIHRLDPRTKLLGLLGTTVVAVSAPLAAWPVFVACALVLAAVAAVASVDARTIWRRARIVLPLIVFVAAFVPFVRRGGAEYGLGPLTVSAAGLAVLATVALKATIGTVGAVLLGATTTFPDVLRGLERLHVPRLLTLIAAFMYRYLFVIVDEVQRMRAALAARGHRPRHALRGAAIGRVVAALFLRTYGRGERVYLAMVSRGYAGPMPVAEPLAFRTADAVVLAATAGLLLGVRALAEVGQ